jgi:hypothetical protein
VFFSLKFFSSWFFLYGFSDLVLAVSPDLNALSLDGVEDWPWKLGRVKTPGALFGAGPVVPVVLITPTFLAFLGVTS